MDVVKLQGEPQVEVDGAVRTLVAFPGARVVYAGPIKERDIVAQTDKDDATTEPATWASADAELVDWFQTAHADGRLPREQFQLFPGQRIANPEASYASLEKDIKAGPKGPRASSLLEELGRIRDVVEGAVAKDQ